MCIIALFLCLLVCSGEISALRFLLSLLDFCEISKYLSEFPRQIECMAWHSPKIWLFCISSSFCYSTFPFSLFSLFSSLSSSSFFFSSSSNPSYSIFSTFILLSFFLFLLLDILFLLLLPLFLFLLILFIRSDVCVYSEDVRSNQKLSLESHV